MRSALTQITRTEQYWDWERRARVLDAIMRAFLREDILLRLPTDVFSDSDETWAESLLKGLHKSGTVQKEPLAERITRFLLELVDMGTEEIQAHLRYAMQQQAESVALVTGSNTADRDAVFNGFNTPLLPDVLVCTDVGGEGIDLQRQCRHIVHYDLDWSPARLEQRTGRVDRIGSKAERERSYLANDSTDEARLPGLDIGLPYLAGTYDERMFEVLRKRAQMFEILTGGDPTADRQNPFLGLEAGNLAADEGAEFIPLPDKMLLDLRLDLAVWHEREKQPPGTPASEVPVH